ncbi:MAG: TetR/AcrR family transcriptional regulator [Alphaproteobacteria bacterium]|nr:TetR/AcrR family transcriptional regulator [Alphaproteobacteria bacterium]MCB9696490.1 TetR/AcrR family transcriptional regulator [Alphaproteobacteria bacterium]
MAYRRTEAVEARIAQTREELLRAALRIVAAGGFSALHIAALAEAAGVATGTVYRHFADKGELCREVFATASQRELDHMAAALASDGPAPTRIERAVRLWVRRAQNGRVLARALLSEPVHPAVEEERLRYRARYAELIARVLAEGVAHGELPAQDPRTSAACIVGALGEAVLGPSFDPDPSDIVDFVLSAVTRGAQP